VALGSIGVGAVAFGWMLSGENNDPPPRFITTPLFISTAVYMVVTQIAGWRYPLERSVHRDESTGTIGPIRWRWIFKSLALVVGGLLALLLATAVISGLVSAVL
jgi:hypothetical protein